MNANVRFLLLVVLSGLSICGCTGASNDATESNVPERAAGAAAAMPRVPLTETRPGVQQHIALASAIPASASNPVGASGAEISFELFEPDQLVAGASYPLVLHGHGYGGSRQTTRDGFLGRLTAAGYYVISIDQRGFGEAGGTVRVMDPEYEGQDLVRILDWAENLPGLRRRSNGEMLVGSYGGSYGGMYQLLLAAVDPKHRLRVLAPDIAPHDLTYALNPNNVIKSGWSLALVAGGESSTVTGLGSTLVDTVTALAGGLTQGQVQLQLDLTLGLRQDPAIYETLLTGLLTNQFPAPGNNWFRYHSVRYFCDGEPAQPQEFLLATPDTLSVPPQPYDAVDALITQGTRDTLFNFNDGLNNYDCLKAKGGDVRLLTHESGHILPLGLPSDVEQALDPVYRLVALQGFQDAGGARSCGSLDLNDAQFAWFEEKLQGKSGAIDQVISTGSKVCLSLGPDDAIAVDNVTRGGSEFAIDSSTPQLNGALGIVGSLLGNAADELLLATQPLYLAPAGGAVLAGLPEMDLTLQGLTGLEMQDCATPLSLPACDPILLLAVGHRKAGTERWDIVDDQLTPVRGFGVHAGPMTGIAERLEEGDELALLIYAFHAQYPVTWSRDLVIPAVTVSGTVRLPLLTP